MLDEWFELVDSQPVLRKEAMGLAVFAELISRNKKKKDIWNKEILFIWYYTDKDKFANYKEGKERAAHIKNRIGIDWELDEVVWRAISEIEEDLVTVQNKLLLEMRNTLHGYTPLLKVYRQKTDESIELLSNLNVANLSDDDKAERNKALNNASTDIKKLLDTSKDLKATFAAIDELAVQDKALKRKSKDNKLENDRTPYKKKNHLD